MNVLHIDEQRGWRGGEQQASYLVRGLAERGHASVIAGRTGSVFLKADHGAETLARVAAPFQGELDLYTAWRLAQAVKRYRIDILHAHTGHAHTMACLAKTFARRGKVVVSRRIDLPPTRHPINRWKYAAPDQIVAISNCIAGVMRDFGVAPARLSVVYSGIDPSRFNVRPLPRAALGVPEDAPLLANVAALVDHKDHATLLAAMPEVLRTIPVLRLVIAGEGASRPQLEAQTARLGIEHAVTLLGRRDDVPRLLRASDAFVLSSKGEGLGTSILDAMACELPVVATDAGGIPEMVAHEQTGFLVPAQDPGALAQAIIRVFQDRETARAVASGGYKLVHERFTVDRMVEGNLRVYEKVLD